MSDTPASPLYTFLADLTLRPAPRPANWMTRAQGCRHCGDHGTAGHSSDACLLCHHPATHGRSCTGNRCAGDPARYDEPGAPARHSARFRHTHIAGSTHRCRRRRRPGAFQHARSVSGCIRPARADRRFCTADPHWHRANGQHPAVSIRRGAAAQWHRHHPHASGRQHLDLRAAPRLWCAGEQFRWLAHQERDHQLRILRAARHVTDRLSGWCDADGLTDARSGVSAHGQRPRS